MAEATTEAQFQQAAEDAKKLTKKPNNSDLLILYGLYKQATEGDCNTSSFLFPPRTLPRRSAHDHKQRSLE